MPDLPAFHGWTHRPKAQGGTDPIPMVGASPTAAFYLYTAGAQQPIESVRTWVPVILSTDAPMYNWDLLTGGPAIDVITDADLFPGDRIRFINALQSGNGHYWFVGASIRIGANHTESTFPAVEIVGYDNDRYPPIMGARVAPSTASPTGSYESFPQSMQYAVPRIGTEFNPDYYYFFVHADAGEDINKWMSFNISGAMNVNDVSWDEEDDPEDRDGLQLQVYNAIEINPDGAAVPPVDWPATFQGHVWGYRYAIGDGVIN